MHAILKHCNASHVLLTHHQVFYSRLRVSLQVLRWSSRLRLHSHLRDPHKSKCVYHFHPIRRHFYEQVRTGQKLHTGVQLERGQRVAGGNAESGPHVDVVITADQSPPNLQSRSKGAGLLLREPYRGWGGLDRIRHLSRGVPKLTRKQNRGVGWFSKTVVPPKDFS